jgi:hypothetical protein
MAESPLKQFFINYKVFQDTFLKPLQSQRVSATGLVLGTRSPSEDGGGRCTIFDVLLTPDAEDSQEDIRGDFLKRGVPPAGKRGLRDLVSTRYTQEMSYATWLELFLESVSEGCV